MVNLKTKHEITQASIACSVVREVLEKLHSFISPGITSKEINSFVEDIIEKRGAVASFKGYHGFPASICASINDVVIHGIPNDTVLKSGDIISVDVGAYKSGFHGDAARTYLCGDVSPEIQQLVKVTEESYFKGIEQFKMHGRLGDISNAIQNHIESFGYGVVREYCGHGIGRELHEDPQVPNYGPKSYGIRLKRGLILAIEPMVTLGDPLVETLDDGWTVITSDGSFAAHYENTAVLTDNGVEILTL